MPDWTEFLTSREAARLSHGNHIRHLDADNHTVEVIWEAIETATTRVWMSMYTLGTDAVGRGTLARLTRAARRGLDVRLVYDQVGSFSLHDRTIAPLREAGGHATPFHPIWPLWKMQGAAWIRNHRKLLLVDEAVGFCGGMNLGYRFAHVHRDGPPRFDDTMVRIDGPAAHDLGVLFAQTWEEVTGAPLSLPDAPEAGDGGVPVLVLETDPRRPETQLIEVISGALRRARAHIDITTPYFIPDVWLLDALHQALDRGVDVRILTAGRTDVALARIAGHACYDDLLEAGARIYEMRDRTIHTKKLTVDGALCSVGSYNFDLWTSRHVLDASIVTVDTDLARSFAAEFEEDLTRSDPIEPDPWRRRGRLRRLGETAALTLARWL